MHSWFDAHLQSISAYNILLLTAVIRSERSAKTHVVGKRDAGAFVDGLQKYQTISALDKT